MNETNDERPRYVGPKDRPNRHQTSVSRLSISRFSYDQEKLVQQMLGNDAVELDEQTGEIKNGQGVVPPHGAAVASITL